MKENQGKEAKFVKSMIHVARRNSIAQIEIMATPMLPSHRRKSLLVPVNESEEE